MGVAVASVGMYSGGAVEEFCGECGMETVHFLRFILYRKQGDGSFFAFYFVSQVVRKSSSPLCRRI